MSFRDGSQGDLFRFDEFEGYSFKNDRSRLKTRTVAGPLYEPFDSISYSQSAPSLAPWLKEGPANITVLNRAADSCWTFCMYPQLVDSGGSCWSTFNGCSIGPGLSETFEDFLVSEGCSELASGEDIEDLSTQGLYNCMIEYLLFYEDDLDFNNQGTYFINFGTCGFMKIVRPCPSIVRLIGDVLSVTTDYAALEKSCGDGSQTWTTDQPPCSSGDGGVVIVDSGDPIDIDGPF